MSRHLTQPEEIDFIELYEFPINMPVQDGNKKDASKLDAKRPESMPDFPEGEEHKKPKQDIPSS